MQCPLNKLDKVYFGKIKFLLDYGLNIFTGANDSWVFRVGSWCWSGCHFWSRSQTTEVWSPPTGLLDRCQHVKTLDIKPHKHTAFMFLYKQRCCGAARHYWPVS